MNFILTLFIVASFYTSACKTPIRNSSSLNDATLIDKENLPPIKFAFWADQDFVYRGYCSWSSAPYDRTSCSQNTVKIPVRQFSAYFQKLDVMKDGYDGAVPSMSSEQRQAAVDELLKALQERRNLAWLPMQRRVPQELREQVKLSEQATLFATRMNQCFLGVGDARAVMPPFMVSIFELTGRGAIKLGIRNGLKNGKAVIVREGKALREADDFVDLYKEIPGENGGRVPTCQLFNSGATPLPPKTILFASGWDRQNPNHTDLTAIRLYKDAQLTQETGYMTCVGAFSEYMGQPSPTFPLGELVATFKDQSDFIFQGYLE